MAVDTKRKQIWGMHPNVFFLGLVSLLNDVGSELIFTLVPLFLKNVLGASTTIVGLTGGISDSSDSLLRIAAGWFSDKIGKRKSLAVLGYTFSTLAKPFMYIANSWGTVIGVRLGDRLGKGVRTASRDALVADSVTAKQRGRGFGLHQAMDSAGAVIGLGIAAVVIYAVQGSGLDLGLTSYRWLVLIGIWPAVLAVLVLVFFVREMAQIKPVKSGQAIELPKAVTPFSFRFKLYLAIIAIFTLGNSSDFFLILRAQNLDVPVIEVVIMLIVFNIIYAGTAFPLGSLSDKLGRRRVLAAGWFLYAAVYFGFALATQVWQAWVLFAIYGIYYGVGEGVGRAFVADLVPADRRGTAYGLYNGIVGLALLPASLIAGFLWDKISPSAPFYFGAALAFLAVVGILTFVKER